MFYSFKKKEKLCGKNAIDELFSKGNSFIEYPFRIVWLPVERPSENITKVLIIVPKKNTKKATDRNRIKRQIRDIYRLNKSIINDFVVQSNINLNIAIIYMPNVKLNYKDSTLKIISAFKRLIDDYGKNI